MSWTRGEKRDLLVALENYGPTNLEEIQKYLPAKSVLEIRHKIREYKALAQTNAQKSETGEAEESALDKWIKLVKTSQSSQSIDNLYSRIFKYISLFENHATGTSVNMRECYYIISELMKGESIKKLDPYTSDFLHECLTALANKINSSDNTKMIDFVKSLEDLDHIARANSVKSYSKKTNMSLINPLRVPEALLTLKNDGAGPSGVLSTSSEIQTEFHEIEDMELE